MLRGHGAGSGHACQHVEFHGRCAAMVKCTLDCTIAMRRVGDAVTLSDPAARHLTLGTGQLEDCSRVPRPFHLMGMHLAGRRLREPTLLP
jgi:hypothetical protein